MPPIPQESKFYSLPPEILGEIFEGCLPPLRQRLAYPQLSFHAFQVDELDGLYLKASMPMTLCHICSYWRAVAFSTPKLWSHLFHIAVIRDVDEEGDDDMFMDITTTDTDNLENTITLPQPISPPALLPLGRSMDIRKKDLDFLRWWAKKAKGNSLSLRLKLRVEVIAASSVEIFTLGDYLRSQIASDNLEEGDLSFFLALISRARYLDIDPEYHSILADRPLLCRPTLLDSYPNLHYNHLESLIIDVSDEVKDTKECLLMNDHLYGLPLERMEALRKLCFIKCAFLDPSIEILATVNGGIAKRLTHIFLHLVTSREKWHCFFTECTGLQKAHFILDIIDSDSSLPGDTPRHHTFPDLYELGLVLHCDGDHTCFPHLLDGTYLPSLDSFLLQGEYMSTGGLSRLLSATPRLKRLRLQFFFPTDITNPPEDPVLFLAPPNQFSTNHGAQERRNRLSFNVPHLEMLMVDFPRTDTGNYLQYVENMVQSGWLDGFHGSTGQESQSSSKFSRSRTRLQNNLNQATYITTHPEGKEMHSNPLTKSMRLKVDLFWKWNTQEAAQIWPIITNLKNFLKEKAQKQDMDEDWCPGVDLAVQVKYDTTPLVTDRDMDSQYWEMWFDHSFEF